MVSVRQELPYVSLQAFHRPVMFLCVNVIAHRLLYQMKWLVGVMMVMQLAAAASAVSFFSVLLDEWQMFKVRPEAPHVMTHAILKHKPF